MFFVGLNAGATLVGPYTADPNTLHLWHLNDIAAPAVDSASSGGMNLAGLLTGATLNNASYTGFGTALNTASTGPGLGALLAAAAAAGNVTITLADTTTGAFTFEANVWIGFDPATNNTVNSYQILSGESQVTANRIFQWRIMPKGITLIAGVVAAQPYVTFENVRAGSAGQTTIYAPIPTTGLDAIAINTWYHVAVSYNGQAGANNIKFYWTLLDPLRTAANQLTITSATTTLTGLNPLATVTTPFVVGNQGRSKNSNFSGLIDEVRISKIERNAVQMRFTSSALAWVTQPQSQFVAAGDTVTLGSLAGGESPQYQWQLYSTNLPNATNASLVLSNIALSQAGPYRVIATNSTSSTNSDVATVRVGHLFAETFNTGLSDNRTLLASGDVDPHWKLVLSDDPNYPVDTNYPAPAIATTAVAGTYLASGPSSMWIAPVEDINTFGTAAGNYTYRTTFLLDTLDAANAILYGGWAMDNAGVEIHLNGVTNALTAVGFGSLTPFTLTNGFVPGLNIMECVITNFLPGATALRVELRGVALDLPSTAPYVTTFPVNVSTQAQQSATFSVAAVGSGSLTYQWYHGATPLIGQSRRTLVLSSLSTADAGTYSVYVTNSIGFTNASAVLTVLTPPALAWLGIDPTNPSFWDSATVNWLDTGSSANVAFAPYDDVLFDSRGSGTPTVNLVEPLSPNSVTVDAATDYTLTGTGSLAGNLILTKKNAGTLIVDNKNTYSGTTVIAQGTLQLGNGDIFGTLGSSAIRNNAALVLNRVGQFRVPNSISGTGSVAAVGSGVAYVAGDNTYTGPTTIASGSTISADSATALGDTSSGTTVAAGGQLYIDPNVSMGAEPVTLSGFGFAITGSEGALRKGGGSTFTIFGGPITLAADAGIKVDANGTLNLTNAAGITGTDVSLTVQADSTGVRGTIAGPITLGTGSFTEYGAGTWVLLATNNTWAGATTINSPGVLQIGDGGTNGSVGASTIANNGTLTFLSANNFLITNVISGGGSLNQNGSGMVTLTAANSYSGLTTIRGSGVLRVTDSTALGSGTCTIGTAQADTGRLELTGGITLLNPITIFPRAFYGVVPATALNVSPDVLNVSGNNTLSPPSSILIGGGGDVLTLQADSGKLVLTAGVTASGGAGRKLALRGAAAGEIQGSLDRTGSFSLNIYKLDSGTWTLSGANTPAGPTTVSNGVLVVSGSLDSTLVTVAGGTLALSGAGALINSTPMTVLAGATLDASGRTDGTLTVGASQSLSGNGTVVGNLLVQGTLTPGASVGRLSASANVSFDGTAQTVMEVNNAAATNDLLTAAGTVTYGGTLTITNISATPYTNNQVLKLFNAAGGFAGSFANIVFPGVAVYDASRLAVDGTIKVAAPLSTARTNLTTTVTGGNVLNVSWPLDHTTWRLLAQTNAPGVGLTPSWFEVPGSASTNRLVLPIDPTVGSVFYRLVYP